MQFRKKLFGYSPAEVQEALEQLEKEKSKITADYEAIVLQVQEQLKAGKTENERLKTELIKAREQQNRYEKDLEEERERLAEAYGEADQLKKKYENKSLLLSKGMVEMQDQKAQILRKAEELAQQQMRDTHRRRKRCCRRPEARRCSCCWNGKERSRHWRIRNIRSGKRQSGTRARAAQLSGRYMPGWRR